MWCGLTQIGATRFTGARRQTCCRRPVLTTCGLSASAVRRRYRAVPGAAGGADGAPAPTTTSSLEGDRGHGKRRRSSDRERGGRLYGAGHRRQGRYRHACTAFWAHCGRPPVASRPLSRVRTIRVAVTGPVVAAHRDRAGSRRDRHRRLGQLEHRHPGFDGVATRNGRLRVVEVATPTTGCTPG